MSRYWNNEGRYQALYEQKYKELVPNSGEAKTLEGNVLRVASKCVYRRYNDGEDFNYFCKDYKDLYGDVLDHLPYCYNRIDYDNMIDGILEEYWPDECKKIGGVSNKDFDYSKYGEESPANLYYSDCGSDSEDY